MGRLTPQAGSQPQLGGRGAGLQCRASNCSDSPAAVKAWLPSPPGPQPPPASVPAGGCRQLVRDARAGCQACSSPGVETGEAARELIDDNSDGFCSSAAFRPGGLMGLSRN